MRLYQFYEHCEIQKGILTGLSGEFETFDQNGQNCRLDLFEILLLTFRIDGSK